MGPARELVAAALLIVAAACGRGGARPADAGPLVVGEEDVAIVRRQTLRTGPRIAGSLEPARQAVLRAEVGGAVLNVQAEVGQRVRQGALLARIEAAALEDATRSAQLAVQAAEEARQIAERQVQRTERLVAGGAVPERELETARTQLASARAQEADARARAASARQQRGNTVVRAPLAGVVSERAVNEGDIVAPGAPLFTVIDPSSMRLEANVPSDAIGELRVGTPVLFTVRGYGDTRFEGQIARIAPAAEPTTRQIPLLVTIPNPSGRLLAGLFAEGRVATQAREALVLPLSAVDLASPTPTVTRVQDGRAHRVAVTVGLRDESAERVEIATGVREGDRVLIGAALGTEPGTAVQLRPAGAQTDEAALGN